jgi:hypothetical protein
MNEGQFVETLTDFSPLTKGSVPRICLQDIGDHQRRATIA